MKTTISDGASEEVVSASDEPNGASLSTNRSGWSDFRGRVALMIVASAVQMVGPMGLQAYTFGVFVKPLQLSFGWGLQAINIAFSCVLFGQVLGGPFAGALVDRIGPRKVALTAVPLLGLLTCGLSLLWNSLSLFYAIYLFLGIGVAFSYVALGKMLSLVFRERRGTAMGILAAGSGLGALLGPVTIRIIVDKQGWGAGYLAMGFLLLIVVPGLFIWFRQGERDGAVVEATNRASHEGLSGRGAARTPMFWMFLSAFGLYGIAAGGILPNLLPFLTESGVSRAQAASYVGMLGLCTMMGRLATGALLDRLNGARLLATLIAGEALALVTIGVFRLDFLIPALLVYGFAHGGEVASLPYLTGRLFGLRHFGLLFGFASAAAFTGFGLGPIVFSGLREHTGSYLTPFLTSACLAAIASTLLFSISCMSRKNWD